MLRDKKAIQVAEFKRRGNTLKNEKCKNKRRCKYIRNTIELGTYRKEIRAERHEYRNWRDKDRGSESSECLKTNR